VQSTEKNLYVLSFIYFIRVFMCLFVLSTSDEILSEQILANLKKIQVTEEKSIKDAQLKQFNEWNIERETRILQ